MKWDARKGEEIGRNQWVKVLEQVCEEGLEPEQTENMFLSLKGKLKDALLGLEGHTVPLYKEKCYLEHKYQA